LESGIWYSPEGGWSVYYYGDDNGLTGNPAECNQLWPSGGTCGGAFSNLAPGRKLKFKYEWCTTAHVASVNGTQACLYVDMEDGAGYRFLAEDSRTNPDGSMSVEMYTHDVEWWPSTPDRPAISCTNPTRMLGQTRKTTSGSWVNMTGAST